VSAVVDLSRLAPGFVQPALDSQTVFRTCLDALSDPGSVKHLASGLLESTPAGASPAAVAVLLALLDQDTTLWLGEGLRDGDVAAYLRFHTGCPIARSPAEAGFALLACGDEAASLSDFMQGSETFPDRSATLVVQCDGLSNTRDAMDGAGCWRLTGPGIREQAWLQVAGASADFPRQWASNRKCFPRGVDVFFASGLSLAGLPRTTRLEA
jgi:alpha-D-ribose 1-methylphosphonate 5-triphosphate synthase subunit PhnH